MYGAPIVVRGLARLDDDPGIATRRWLGLDHHRRHGRGRLIARGPILLGHFVKLTVAIRRDLAQPIAGLLSGLDMAFERGLKGKVVKHPRMVGKLLAEGLQLSKPVAAPRHLEHPG